MGPKSKMSSFVARQALRPTGCARLEAVEGHYLLPGDEGEAIASVLTPLPGSRAPGSPELPAPPPPRPGNPKRKGAPSGGRKLSSRFGLAAWRPPSGLSSGWGTLHSTTESSLLPTPPPPGGGETGPSPGKALRLLRNQLLVNLTPGGLQAVRPSSPDSGPGAQAPGSRAGGGIMQTGAPREEGVKQLGPWQSCVALAAMPP